MNKNTKIYVSSFLVLATGVITAGCSSGDELKPVPADPALSSMPPAEYVPPPGAAGSGGQPMPGSKKGGG